MPDDADRAAVLTDAWRENCLGARLRELAKPGTLDCEACDAPIPAARRQAHPSATRCVACQALAEAETHRRRGE